MDKLQVISQTIFNSELLVMFMPITLGLSISYPLIKSISSRLSEPFLIGDYPILMVVDNFIPVSYIVLSHFRT